jgi:NADH:ubiquinone oxidoreductase subunit H
MQPMKDIIRLWRKGAVYSSTTSIIFQIAPTVYFASVLMGIMMIPHENCLVLFHSMAIL